MITAGHECGLRCAKLPNSFRSRVVRVSRKTGQDGILSQQSAELGIGGRRGTRWKDRDQVDEDSLGCHGEFTLEAMFEILESRGVGPLQVLRKVRNARRTLKTMEDLLKERLICLPGKNVSGQNVKSMFCWTERV